MFQEHIYDLSRLKYKEFDEQLEGLYVPLQDEKPGLVRRLLTALRGTSAGRAPKPSAQSSAREAHASVVAK
jgi:hypothetical protein